jgi:hypothetical protein
MSDRDRLTWLTLQIERDLTVQAHLKVLLTASGTAIAGYRRELRNLKARKPTRRR